MKKALDVNAIMTGGEPKFSAEVSQTELTKALSWYSQNKDNKDAQKYASDYFKKKLKLNVTSVFRQQSSTFGFICRIVLNGGVLNEKNQIWFNDEIEKIKASLNQSQEEPPVVKTNVVSIQDHIKRKAKECIAELENQIDNIILQNTVTAPYSVLTAEETKGPHTKFIIEHFKLRRAEYDEVLHTSDAELKEAYSNFSKTDLKKLVAYCDSVIVDATKIAGESLQTRKPRKRKAKTAEQLIGKLVYCKEFADLKLQSIEPKLIIGATQLWVYNTKTRKLGCYIADDASGFTVKGTSIQGFSESKSVQKKLRKPELTIPEILKGGKVYLRNALAEIKAVESPLTGRLNSDTILVKVTK
jgi:hypothetical protein